MNRKLLLTYVILAVFIGGIGLVHGDYNRWKDQQIFDNALNQCPSSFKTQGCRGGSCGRRSSGGCRGGSCGRRSSGGCRGGSCGRSSGGFSGGGIGYSPYKMKSPHPDVQILQPGVAIVTLTKDGSITKIVKYNHLCGQPPSSYSGNSFKTETDENGDIRFTEIDGIPRENRSNIVLETITDLEKYENEEKNTKEQTTKNKGDNTRINKGNQGNLTDKIDRLNLPSGQRRPSNNQPNKESLSKETKTGFDNSMYGDAYKKEMQEKMKMNEMGKVKNTRNKIKSENSAPMIQVENTGNTNNRLYNVQENTAPVSTFTERPTSRSDYFAAKIKR